MQALMQPLRDEHATLVRQIEGIRRVADAIGVVPVAAVRKEIAGVREFLVGQLIPHARAEDVAMYPVVGRAMGASEATATMRHDHEAIVDLTEQLAALEPELMGDRLAPGVERALRRILYGLYMLVRVHLEEEEQIYLSILDARLTPDEAHEMLEAMENAAEKFKAEV